MSYSRPLGSPITEYAENSEGSQTVRTLTLLDQILEQTEGTEASSPALLDQFLSAKNLSTQLKIWCGSVPATAEERRIAFGRISRDIVRLDKLLAAQVNAILHHKAFQRLEASWRGLAYLIDQVEEVKSQSEHGTDVGEIRVQIFDVKKRELRKDFEKAIEFDQSVLFKKVYEEEFGTAGGEPFGVLIGDFEFSHQAEDLELLGQISDVAASAFAPFIAGASPQMFGMDDFSPLEQPVSLSQVFEQLEYMKWRSLRTREETQFLGLTLPHVLMRQPYQHDGSHSQGFPFTENVNNLDRSGYLWGNASWAFAAVVIRAFGSTGWLADIRGSERGVLGGGIVNGLQVHQFSTDHHGIALKSSTDVSIGDQQEKELCQLGFLPLSDCPGTPYSVFYSNQSVHSPKTYDDPLVTTNARISAMLQYILCASRFSHYLKIQFRNQLGRMVDPSDLQVSLNNWLSQYVTADDLAPSETKARYPLRLAQAEVTEIPGQAGHYRLKIHLLPHYQLDQLVGEVRLLTKILDPNQS